MAKDLTLNVVARKDSKQLSELAAEFDRLRQEVDASGKSMQKHETFAQFLDAQLKKQQGTVRALGEEFKRTGSIDVFAKLKSAEKDLAGLERLSKSIASAVSTGVETGGKEGFKAFSADLQGALSTPILGPAITVGVVGAIVAASPFIGGAINGALLAGVGLGGVATGIVGQLHDPAVRKAFGDLKTTATDTLSDSTRAFGPVLVDAAHEFTDILTKAKPTLTKVFDDLAPHAEKLIQGLEGLGKEAAPGFLEAIKASGPILDQLGQDLPQLGHSFSTFFHAIAQGEPGAKDALHDLLVVIDATVVGTGYAIEGLSKAFSLVEAGIDFTSGKYGSGTQHLNDFWHGVNNATTGGKDLFGALTADSAAARELSTEMDRLNGGLSTLIGNQLSVAQSNDAFQKGLNDLGQALDQNNHTLVGNSDAAIQNRGAIEALIGQAEQAREAQIQMAGGANASKAAVDAANASYTDAINKIEAIGVKAGLSKKDLDALVGEYDINVVVNVSGSGRSVINADGSITIGGHSPKIIARAAGGPVTAGQPYIVGEHRPELFVPNQSGVIIPKLPPPPSFVASSASRSRSSTRIQQPIQLVTPGGRVLWETVLEFAADTGQVPANLWPTTRR